MDMAEMTCMICDYPLYQNIILKVELNARISSCYLGQTDRWDQHLMKTYVRAMQNTVYHWFDGLPGVDHS